MTVRAVVLALHYGGPEHAMFTNLKLTTTPTLTFQIYHKAVIYNFKLSIIMKKYLLRKKEKNGEENRKFSNLLFLFFFFFVNFYQVLFYLPRRAGILGMGWVFCCQAGVFQQCQL